jgi:hypothetical protein
LFSAVFIFDVKYRAAVTPVMGTYVCSRKPE